MSDKIKHAALAALILFSGLLTALVFACMVNQGEWVIAIQALVPWGLLVTSYWGYRSAYRRTRKEMEAKRVARWRNWQGRRGKGVE